MLPFGHVSRAAVAGRPAALYLGRRQAGQQCGEVRIVVYCPPLYQARSALDFLLENTLDGWRWPGLGPPARTWKVWTELQLWVWQWGICRAADHVAVLEGGSGAGTDAWG